MCVAYWSHACCKGWYQPGGGGGGVLLGYYHLDGILSKSSLHQLTHTLCEGFVKLDATIICSVNQKFVEQDATNSQWHLACVKCEYYQVLECEYSEQLG